MSYVLGVDGGNTKTIALVARTDGTVVGVGRAGSGDIYGTPLNTQTIPGVEQAVGAALALAGVPAHALASGAFSLAGADWPEDFAFIRSVLAARGFGRTITIVNDALGALRAGSPDGTGVAVVCGTGGATGARAADGRVWHSSFWQEPNGATELSRQMLAAVYRADLGIDPPTALTARTLAYFEQPSVEHVLHLLTARGTKPPPHVRHLARVLLDEAHAGDTTARAIVEHYGARLGDYALAAARKIGMKDAPFTLVLAGGVLRHASPLLSNALIARVRRTSPQIEVVNSGFEPAIGALLLALEAAGSLVDDALLARLVDSHPPSSLFDSLLLT